LFITQYDHVMRPIISYHSKKIFVIIQESSLIIDNLN